MNEGSIFGLFSLTSLEVQFIAVIVGGLVVFLIFLAWRQLRSTTKATHSQLLLQLDARWDTKVVAGARRELRNIAVSAFDALSNHEANDLHKLIVGEIRRGEYSEAGQQLRRKISEQLDTYSTSTLEREHKRYITIMSLWSFFETLGGLVYRRYLPIEDAYHLYGSSIFVTYELCSVHIEKLQEVTPHCYQHYRTLSKKCSILERFDAWPAPLRKWLFVPFLTWLGVEIKLQRKPVFVNFHKTKFYK